MLKEEGEAALAEGAAAWRPAASRMDSISPVPTAASTSGMFF
jgi:hypothetical protein